tara:strand:- start:1943 stop:2680 length:738 start_codon:yes stop_codon:yes gene_type:complete
MIAILIGLVIQTAYADELDLLNDKNVGETIIVEARRNMVIYVEDPIIDNVSKKISNDINDASIAGYVNSHSRLGKVKNQRGAYEPVTMHTERIEVYDANTINYAYEDCNYKKDALACAVKNDHYLVRTNISINDHEVVVRMTLYDSSALIVNTSSNGSKEVVRWIKQQEVNTATTTPAPATVQPSNTNCIGVNCIPLSANQQLDSTTNIDKPKEDLPLRFSIPPRLIDKNLHQASIGLFMGVKLD